MKKLNLLPIEKLARIVYQKNGDWYFVWYDNHTRIRAKFGINKIKDLDQRQKVANQILDCINFNLKNGIVVDFNTELSVDTSSPESSQVDDNHSDSITFLNYFEVFIELKKKNCICVEWIRKLNTFVGFLRRFAVKMGVVDWQFSEIDRDWAANLRAFCVENGHSINYIAKIFKTVRQVLMDADHECDDIEVNPKYKSKAFKIKEVETDEIALSIDEIQRIYEVDLSLMAKGYSYVRDSFVFACLTGLRWSDWNIKPGNLHYMNNKPVLKVVTQKTNDLIVIPLHTIAFDILKKYNFDLPEISNQKSNQYLKVIADMAQLYDNVILRRSEAGKVVVLHKQKYEEVKTHTARRSFITIALTVFKLPASIVMRITGHKSEKQLFKYARITEEEAALMMRNAMQQYLFNSLLNT